MPKALSKLRTYFEGQDFFDSALFQVASWSLLGSCVIIQILASLSVPTDHFDGAIQLVGADLVRRGKIPLVDFWHVYPPMLDYMLAEAFRLFGRTDLINKTISAVLYLGVIVTVARFFRRQTSHLRPLVPFMVLPVALVIGLSISDASWPASALGLMALITYAGSADKGQAGTGMIRWTLVEAGSLAGVAALFRVNFGLYALAVMATDVLVSENRPYGSSALKDYLRRVILPLISVATPFIFFNAAMYASIYGTSTVSIVMQMVGAAASVIKYRFIDLPLTRTVGFAAWPCVWTFLRIIYTSDCMPSKALAALCPVPLLIGLIVAVRHTPSVAIWLPVFSGLVVLFLYYRVLHFSRVEFCLLLYFVCILHYYLSRADSFHSHPVFPVLALVLIAPLPVIANADSNVAFARRGFNFVVLMGAISVVAFRAGPTPHFSFFMRGVRSITSGALGLPVSDAERLAAGNIPWLEDYADLAQDDYTRDELNVVKFIRSESSIGDPIYVGVRDHSKFFANDVGIYWLADRIPGSRYIELEPSVASRPEVQRQIVSDLLRNAVKLAVLRDDSGEDRRFTADSHLLDEFFATTFKEVGRFGSFSVMERTGQDSPR